MRTSHFIADSINRKSIVHALPARTQKPGQCKGDSQCSNNDWVDWWMSRSNEQYNSVKHRMLVVDSWALQVNVHFPALLLVARLVHHSADVRAARHGHGHYHCACAATRAGNWHVRLLFVGAFATLGHQRAWETRRSGSAHLRVLLSTVGSRC